MKSIKNNYQWADLSTLRKPINTAVQNSSGQTPSGWGGGNDGLNVGPTGPGITPGQASMLGTIGQAIGAATGNQDISAASGLLGTAGSSNPAASMAGTAANIAAGGGVGGGLIGGVVSGAVRDGIPGAVKGAAQGVVSGVLGKAVPAIGLISLVDELFNDGKITSSVKDFFSDLIDDIGLGSGVPFGTAKDAREQREAQESANQSHAAQVTSDNTAKEMSDVYGGNPNPLGGDVTATGSGWGGGYDAADLGGDMSQPDHDGNPGDW